MAKISDLIAARSKIPTHTPASSPLDYYANAEGRAPIATTNLADLIDGIRSDEFAGRVAAIRSAIASGDQPRADALKKQLPAVSLSGAIDGRRKAAAAEGRFRHSGLLQIDLDAKDNIGWTVEEMRVLLAADPRIAAVFVTASGAGVKGVARIPADASTHKAAFLAAEAHFRTLNLKIDPSCKDPVRLCFVSHDPAACIIPGTERFEPVFEVVDDPPMFEEDDEEHNHQGERPAQVPRHDFSESGSLRLREGGSGPVEITATTIRDMLAHIPYPGFDGWLKISNAVWAAIGYDEGTPILQAWAPEKNPGDYAAHAKFPCNEIGPGSLVMMARQHGWLPEVPASAVLTPEDEETPGKPSKNTIPAHIFPVPTGEIGHDLASRHIFTTIGPTNRLFMRGTTVHEIAAEETGDAALSPVTPERYCSIVETFGRRVSRRETDKEGITKWRSATFPAGSAKIALASNGARECLPHIRQLVAAPVIVPHGERDAMVLGKGYHPHAGGTFVTDGGMPPVVPLDVALADIMTLIEDFDFPSAGDASRAAASLISPALKLGGWIDDDFPLDIAEADQSQSGKTYRQKLVCKLYREEPAAITQPSGGVGSLDERVSTALITGRPFISFDNFRGRMDSQILETAIRGLGKVSARALRVAVDVDCTPFLWQLSTNGAELTRDLANRSIVTRIRKRADGYVFRVWPEGPTHLHLIANQPRYLGAVFAIVREWARHGCPRTDETRHDFRAWCQCLDWIVQNIFGLAPLLEGHREEQLRTANPRLQWLRIVMHAALKDGYQPMQTLHAADLGQITEDHDIDMPGGNRSHESMELRVGKILGRLFKEAPDETIIVDGHKFTRVITEEYDPLTRNTRISKSYVIE